ncbi:MAG TPA: penicillin-binding transpeptidase domain-containing protein [Trueperaceae bacterium]|nr:penicillin-binding transpeptidase domain-containing protein [Trueperaceae bacterium]HRQ10445.1 penicillin-binding transpeptidase domain-containing protein [Trueperaceae bacterium]
MQGRMKLLLAGVFTILALYTARLMYLQLVMVDEFTARSEQNAIQQRHIVPLRGRILARDGTVLADDRVAYDLLYRGGPIADWEHLSALLGLGSEPRQPDRTKAEEVQNGTVVAWNIPDQLVSAVEERVAASPNLYLRERLERTYPTNLAAQTIGYTSQADPGRNPGYSNNDLVGVMGLEAGLEPVLFGAPGTRQVEVDNRGAEVASKVVFTAQPGQDVTLTLDPKIQRLAEDVLAGALGYVNTDRARVKLPPEDVLRGAIIALDPRTGEILAMASAPTFDQNVFTRRPSDPEAVTAILSDAVHMPLSNRAVEAYAPASTFKIVTSSALLENHYVGPNTEYQCSASFTFGGITWRNWDTYGKGGYNVKEAIADSCNTYFWHAAAVTPDFGVGWAPLISDVVDRAHELGFGARLDIGLPEEKAGRVPDRAWVRAQPQYQHGWLPGFTLNTIIGQGDVLTTPLQLAQLIATVAMNGFDAEPHLIAKVGDHPVETTTRQIPGDYYSTLKEGMRMMFTDFPSRNTLGPRVFPVSVAGKTGTAQTSRGGDYTHAWFMGFSPYEAPEVAVVVFIEYGGSSSRVSVPIARDFLAGYWRLRGVEVPEKP